MSQIPTVTLSLLLCAALLAAALAAGEEPMSFARVAQPRPVLGRSILVTGNSTLRSPNQTFEIGFFSLDGGGAWYLGIWYASIPIRTYVWVANRAAPVHTRLTPATLELSADGRLRLRDSAGREVWTTRNPEPAAEARLLDTGNLVLLAPGGTGLVVWQSFDEPGDTWLPGMAVTPRQWITGWRSASDPSPGPYSLRLRPPEYGEFELVYSESPSPSSRGVRYWSTGRWVGNRFTGVPEMTVPYIYTFRFDDPFTPAACFVYNQKPPLVGMPGPLLTRFVVDPSGQFRQYVWSAQAASWEMFWARPEDPCDVHAFCGDLGFCVAGAGGFRPCKCLSGLQPVYPAAWGSGDFSGGCRSSTPCYVGDALTENEGSGEFANLGAVELDAEKWVSMSEESRSSCEESCRKNCSCKGISYALESRLCRCLFGAVLNLRNASRSGSTTEQVLFLRLPANSSASALSYSSASSRRPNWRAVEILAGSGGGIVLISGVAAVLMLRRKKKRKRERREGRFRSEKGTEDMRSRNTHDDDNFSAKRGGEPAFASNLQVFSYKELMAATRGFSEKLGHGGFGAVFRGELPDSTLIAVKRLERRGGGDREFRAEVRTIGSVQHVNLVRLRGFCSEDPHRILVYEYMPNGPLSSYLLRGRTRPEEEDQDGAGTSSSQPPPQPASSPTLAVLPWRVRFRVAVGTARGLAYLHEECHDCIIHCDIKPENILIDGDFAAKVSDFGMAKLLGRDLSRVLTTMRGTWGYVAPEWISGVAITAKADVYSYGMTLLEIISGRRNVQAPPPTGSGSDGGDDEEEDKEEREKWFFPPWAARKIVEGDVAAVVDSRLLQEVPGSGGYDAEEARRAAVTAVWCIQDQEAARPSMGTVVKMLEGTIEVGVPPLPQLLQALVSGDSFPRDAAAALDGTGAGSRSTTTSTLGD